MNALRPVLLPILIGLTATFLFSIRLGTPPDFDELYHILAARSYLETGNLAIAEGVYNRGALFTILISQMFALFGDDIAIARLPSLFSFVCITIGLYLWLAYHCNRSTGLVASLLFMTSPFVIDLAVYTRFYGLQCAFFFFSVVIIEYISRNPTLNRKFVLLLFISLFGLIAALYLQIITAIGIVGLIVWLAGEFMLPWIKRLSVVFRILILVVLPIGLLIAIYELGILNEIIERFRYTPAYFSSSANEIWFYHFWFVLYYPTLWTLLPILFLAGFTKFRRIVLLCSSIFLTAFILHSLAGMKGVRYIAYALPFLYAVFAIGLVALWPNFRTLFVNLWQRAFELPEQLGIKKFIERSVFVMLVGFLIIANAASIRSVMMLTGIRIPPQPPLANWEAAAEELADWLEQAEVVLTTSELHALFYLGRYDVLISRSRMTELAQQRDFERDHRTGRPVVATAEAVRRIIDCTQSGIVISDGDRWRSSTRLDDSIADLLVQEADPLPLPPSWSIIAYTWDHSSPASRSAECSAFKKDVLEKLDDLN